MRKPRNSSWSLKHSMGKRGASFNEWCHFPLSHRCFLLLVCPQLQKKSTLSFPNKRHRGLSGKPNLTSQIWSCWVFFLFLPSCPEYPFLMSKALCTLSALPLGWKSTGKKLNPDKTEAILVGKAEAIWLALGEAGQQTRPGSSSEETYVGLSYKQHWVKCQSNQSETLELLSFGRLLQDIPYIYV